jgi:DNA-binding MarR family transcriptional regulator
MPTSTDTKAALARRAWVLMFDYLMRTAPRRTRVLDRHGLTPNDSRALLGLHARDGRTMRELADEWRCDASNATWIIDRLERLGLAERRGSPADRRVKLVTLTARGVALRETLVRAFHAPPADFAALPRADLQALARALGKLGAGPPIT